MGFAEELEELCQRGDPRLLLVEIAAVLASALRTSGIDPILVGGAAARFHTAGAYVSGDIDFVAAGDPSPVLQALGFERTGRHFVHPRYELFVEFPSSHLDAGESCVVTQIGSHRLRVVSAGDLLLDRLNGFKWGGAEVDGATAVVLLRLHPELVDSAIRSRAADQDVLDALEALSADAARKLSPDRIARRVRRQWRGR
jgi:hypothetical protein